MANNDYPAGTPEWYAWGLGNDYAAIHGNERPDPLSGEWAGDPVPHEVITQTWKAVLGDSWDTYVDGTDEDRDADDEIVEAWLSGYEGEDSALQYWARFEDVEPTYEATISYSNDEWWTVKWWHVDVGQVTRNTFATFEGAKIFLYNNGYTLIG